jgi:hypothetical protein
LFKSASSVAGVSDPDSIRSVDPDPCPYSNPNPGGQRTHKVEKSRNFIVGSAGHSLLKGETFSVISGGLGIGKLYFDPNFFSPSFMTRNPDPVMRKNLNL